MSLDPRAVKFHTLGNTLTKDQKYNEAIANFRKAINLEPEYSAAYYHLAETLEEKKLEDEAYQMYKKAIELNTSYATQHIDAGLDSLLSGPLGKAVAEYKKSASDKDGATGNDQNLDPGITAASGIAAPAEGSPVDLATRPAIDRPRGQVGLKPVKLIIEPALENISSRVWSYDSVSATVLGDRDIPVAQATVCFKLVCDQGLQDAFIALTPERANAEQGPDELHLKTDNDGKAKIFFRRSKIAGSNKIEIKTDELPPQFFEDNTHAADIARVEISPRGNQYRTAQEVEFRIEAYDEFDNPVADTELALSLQMQTKTEWEVVDNDNIKTDGTGRLTRVFRMPTRGHTRCRFEVACKTTGFEDNVEFNVVPGQANFAMFIPAETTVVPGQQFAIKMRLLDEYDNPIDGVPATIIIEESSGGEWLLSEASSATTGMDGGITVNVTAPGTAGATAVFAPRSEYLPATITARSRVETVGAESSQTADEVVYDEFGGEFDDEPPASHDPHLLDVELSGDSLAGLPDMAGETASQDYAPADQPATVDEFAPENEEAGGFDSLDYDAAGAASSYTDDTDVPESPPVAPPAHAEPVPGGSTLDVLGSMLDEEAAPPQDQFDVVDAGADELTAPSNTYTEPVADAAPDDLFVLPDDTQPGEDQYSTAVEEPSFDEPQPTAQFDNSFPLPDDSEPAFEPTKDYSEPDMFSPPQEQVQATGGDIYFIKPDESLACCAGEVVPIKITAKHSDGAPSSDIVRFELIEDIGPGAAAVMLAPGGVESGRFVDVEPDLSGEAVAHVKTSGTCGSFTVNISSGATADSITINVAPGAPEMIEIIAPKLELEPGETIDIAARITDTFDNPVPGEFVAISMDGYTGAPGALGEQAQTLSDDNGEVTTSYTAPSSIGDSITITASNPNVGDFSIRKAILTTIDSSAGYAAQHAQDAGADYEPEYTDPAVYGDQPAEIYEEPAPEYQEEYSEESYTEPVAPAVDNDYVSAPGGIEDPQAFLASQTGGGPDEPPPPVPAGDYTEPADYPEAPAMPADDFAPPPAAGPDYTTAGEDFAPQMPVAPAPAFEEPDSTQPDGPPPMPGEQPDYQPEAALPDYSQEGAAMDDQTMTDDQYAVENTTAEDTYEEDIETYIDDGEDNPYAIPTFEIEVGKKAMVEMEQLMPKIIKIGLLVVFLMGMGILYIFTHKIVIYQWYYRQALQYENNNNYAKAIEAGMKAHAVDPERPGILNKMANIHIQNSERAEKRNDLQTAESEINQAISDLEKLLVIKPSDTDALFSYGQAFEQKQDYCSAMKQFERILEHDPSYQAAAAKRNVLREKCRLMQGAKNKRGRGRRE